MARLRNACETLACARALFSLSRRLAGALASPLPMAMDANYPWQDPEVPAVEAVEPCSRPLLFQQSWCAYI